MTATASIIFRIGTTLETIRVQSTVEGQAWHWPSSDDQQFTGPTWRLLADPCAIVLQPVCDAQARPVVEVPQFDRAEVWPVRWGYPESLATDYPEEAARLRQRYDETKPGCPWEEWFKENGLPDLWERFATDEMKRHWLNFRNGLGASLSAYAGHSGHIPWKARECINFRADFYTGDHCHTILLNDCAKLQLTEDERRHSPAHLARQEKLTEATAKNIARGEATAERLHAVASEVQKASDTGDLYSNPSIADAVKAAVSKGVPGEFVAYCREEMHGSRFPTGSQAHHAVQTKPLFRALRTPKTPSPSTVKRWLRKFYKELDKRGQAPPRAKGKAAKRVRDYDVERHPAPTPEDAEPEAEE